MEARSFYQPQPHEERRGALRLEADLPTELLESTEISLAQPLQGRVLDISKEGLKVRFWHDAQPGAYFSLSINFNGRDSICLAQVIWKRDTNRGMVFGMRVIKWSLMDSELERSLASPFGYIVRAASSLLQ